MAKAFRIKQLITAVYFCNYSDNMTVADTVFGLNLIITAHRVDAVVGFYYPVQDISSVIAPIKGNVATSQIS